MCIRDRTDIVQVIKQKKTGFLLANIILSSYQKKIAKKMDISAGAEMMQGIQSAKELNAELVLACLLYTSNIPEDSRVSLPTRIRPFPCLEK